MITKEDISKDFQNKVKAIDGGICAVSNVKVAGVRDGKYGVALILSPDSDVAGVFTSNKVIAAPVDYTKRVIADGKISAIVANSGNANCFTGDSGIWDCENTVETVSKLLDIDKNEVATASTGVIGRKMPMDIINNLINKTSERLENSADASRDAAKAIMTLDTVYKEFAVEVTLENGKTIKIGAICKGIGMIAPNMGTMLCFIATDAIANQKILKRALKIAVNDSFNMVVVDGDESTNDIVLFFANGESKNSIINTNKNYNFDGDEDSGNSFDSSDKKNFGINLNLNLGANASTNIDLDSNTDKSKMNPDDILNKIKGNLGINLDMDIDGNSIDVDEDNIKAFTFGSPDFNADFNVEVNGVCVNNSKMSKNSSNGDSAVNMDSDGNINIDINDEFDISDIGHDSDFYIDKNFQEGLNILCKDLAKKMAKDGEGATKFLEVEVSGAKTKSDAQLASKSVVRSPLVKAAVFGGDPNWGRIVAAVGYSGASIDPNKITVAISSENNLSYLVLDGEVLAFEDTDNLKYAEELMKNKEIKIIIDLNEGKNDATAYGCDLTYEYVKINSEYTT